MAQESIRHSTSSPAGESGRLDLDALRERIGAMERLGTGRDGRAGVMPTGIAAIDAHLPWRGLPRGCLHEIVSREGDGAGPGFAAYLLARLAAFGPVLWLSPRPDAYAPALEQLGRPGWTRRLLLVQARRRDELLWAMEESLHAPGPAAVLGEIAAADMVASRRLQLAAETRGATAILLRVGALDAAARAGSVAATRWRAASAPSGEALTVTEIDDDLDEDDLGEDAPSGPEDAIGPARWSIGLLRCRGGRPNDWLVEKDDETDSLAVVSPLRDGQAGAEGAGLGR
ncbi:MAG: ImuA family protein [Alphaproteobacteria bacterium]